MRRKPTLNLISARHFSTEVPFILPDIGEGIVEVEVLQWHVNEGDEIKQFDLVCEVQSDKANVDITSRYDGVVKSIEVAAGEMAEVGKPLIILHSNDKSATQKSSVENDTSSSSSSSSSSTKTEAKDSAKKLAAPGPGGKVRTTPAVRALAKEHNIDLTLISPTGRDGRLLKEDVIAFLNSESSETTQQSSPQTSRSISDDLHGKEWRVISDRSDDDDPIKRKRITPEHSVPSKPPSPAQTSALEDRVTKVSGLKRTMVKTMVASNEIPTFVFSDEVNVDNLVRVRTDLKHHLEKKSSKLSYMPFFLKATSLSLLEFPGLNSVVNSDCSEIREVGRHNIGIAMDTPQGLIVPIIHDVQDLNITQIANEIIRLQYLGERGKLGEEELKGGTISLSNIGSIGGKSFTAMIVPPQVAIGAIGRIETLPRYDENMNLKPTKIMGVSWSADHRVIDGATVARFHQRWKSYLEDPHIMLLETR